MYSENFVPVLLTQYFTKWVFSPKVNGQWKTIFIATNFLGAMKTYELSILTATERNHKYLYNSINLLCQSTANNAGFLQTVYSQKIGKPIVVAFFFSWLFLLIMQ